MAVLLENVTNYVWQAFVYLQQDNGGFVHKSKLKVLTANIGTLLDLYGIEKGLEHFRSTTTLNFDQFRYYLQREVFSSLPDKITPSELKEYESKIAEVCWLICRKKHLNRETTNFSDASVYQLFRIFCVLAELIPDKKDENLYQVLLHSAEAYSIARNLSDSLGSSLNDEEFVNLSIQVGSFRFTPFLKLLETKCLEEVKDQIAIEEAVSEIYQTIVEDVIKKGTLSKRGYIFPTMKEYWFVLKPSELSYYKSRTERERCGSIAIEHGSKIEPKTGYRILLHTLERIYELEATDHMSRLQWISALQQAAEYSGQSYQRLQASKRRQHRQSKTQDMIRAKLQLQQERLAREAAEGQAKELEAVVKEEAKKLNDLEQLRIKLEKLLEEETQAKRDEEIVRALQARVLAEEWEKREEMERLQEEQRLLLEEERGKRIEYEELQRIKEEQLNDAQQKLKQLEKERELLDEQLKLAQQKLKSSEGRKELFESRLYQVVPNLKNKNNIRRTQSFVPSTKEKPITLEIRPSTLKRTNKK